MSDSTMAETLVGDARKSMAAIVDSIVQEVYPEEKGQVISQRDLTAAKAIDWRTSYLRGELELSPVFFLYRDLPTPFFSAPFTSSVLPPLRGEVTFSCALAVHWFKPPAAPKKRPCPLWKTQPNRTQ
ncbi:hypothetical protein DPEC_G00088310 [Dallia pectoralis]|uniref:Uncharacterized protein n=1 Tax=Dallia pectoralis TaxID=75939 RepID=A0ACC2H0N0_DALPE|nr:hypothetical protein DPEC_G00088310 [Dallia pectoralis]